MTPKAIALTAALALSSCSRPQVTQVNDATFLQEVLGNDRPVIVNFYTNWCPACNYARPYFNDLSAEYKDRMKFAAYNCESGTLCYRAYNITAYPTFVIFKEGEEVGRQKGFNYDILEDFIEEHIR